MKLADIEVSLIDSCGTDLSVVNAARVSFHKESQAMCERDEKLITYLAKHKHTSPFNHAFASFRVKAPIFVARQLVKHKFLPWNEVSRRYVTDEVEFFLPNEWRIKPEGNVKQGSGTGVLPKPEYKFGFCKECGTQIEVKKIGRAKEYCSDKCKTHCKNKYKNPYRTVFDNCKARVKREGIWEFDLDFDSFEFPEFCPYLGIKLDYDFGKGSIKENSPSFDRIDPGKGYVAGNVEIVSFKANTMKSNASVEEQIKMAEAVLLRHKGMIVETALSPEKICQNALDLYNAMIDEGYTPEQARMVLPQNTMTTWIWSGTLGAWGDMCKLRLDPHSQKETRIVAEKISEKMSELFPVSWKALLEN